MEDQVKTLIRKIDTIFQKRFNKKGTHRYLYYCQDDLEDLIKIKMVLSTIESKDTKIVLDHIQRLVDDFTMKIDCDETYTDLFYDFVPRLILLQYLELLFSIDTTPIVKTVIENYIKLFLEIAEGKVDDNAWVAHFQNSIGVIYPLIQKIDFDLNNFFDQLLKSPRTIDRHQTIEKTINSIKNNDIIDFICFRVY